MFRVFWREDLANPKMEEKVPPLELLSLVWGASAAPFSTSFILILEKIRSESVVIGIPSSNSSSATRIRVWRIS